MSFAIRKMTISAGRVGREGWEPFISFLKFFCHEELVGIKDKKLFGAIVGAVVDSDVKTFALERGLYVVKIREEEEKLDIAEPETRRTW